MSKKLQIFKNHLIQWNKNINLIAKSQMGLLDERHFANCAQMFPYLPNEFPDKPFVDLGSGGGFPAILIAIYLHKPVIMVEKDTKKAIFLREALRLCDLRGSVIQDLCENCDYIDGEFITARAFLPLPKLVSVSHKQFAGGRFAYLLKGENIAREIAECNDQNNAKFPLQYEIFPLKDGSNLVKLRIING